MRKQKTHKSAAKRFRITKKGKVLHRSHNLRHLRSAKTKKQIRSLKMMKKVKGSYVKKIKRLLARA